MKIKNGRKTITTKIAYIAGFFDGEGCVRIKKANQYGNSYYVWVAITNSNKNILNNISDLFGGQVRLAEADAEYESDYGEPIGDTETVSLCDRCYEDYMENRKEEKQ